jgi:hypothetical protein
MDGWAKVDMTLSSDSVAVNAIKSISEGVEERVTETIFDI